VQLAQLRFLRIQATEHRAQGMHSGAKAKHPCFASCMLLKHMHADELKE
jgi:hypothetical protein